jgi:hypothetical protein
MFRQDEIETPVIFRKFGSRHGGDVIALFPTVPGTYDPYTCSSYVHVGQHGSADPQYVINGTRAAKPSEYAELRKELESAPYGYRLKIYKRLQRSFFDVRRKELEQTRGIA